MAIERRAALLALLGLAGLVAAAPLPEQYRAYLPQADLLVESQPLSPAQIAFDRHIFRRTRQLEGDPRWKLAIADGGPGVLDAFACATGVTIPKAKVPALVRLLSRYRTDVLNGTRVKVKPVAPGRGALCLSGKALDMAQAAPAAQSAWGWSVGLILAEALPARAGPIMDRARAYGDSAAICGFTGIETVNRGRDYGAMLLARARAEPAFTADLNAAIADVRAAARQGSAPDPGACEVQARTLAISL